MLGVMASAARFRGYEPSSDPAWTASVIPSAMTWGQITGTNLSAADGAPGDGHKPYSGLAISPAGVVYWFAGGHADSPWNGMAAIDLGSAVPVWLVINAQSPSYTDNAAYNADGKPAARHSGWHSQFSITLNKVMQFGGYALAGNGGSASAHVDGFDAVTHEWDASGTYADIPDGAYNVNFAVCMDTPGNGYIYRPDTGKLSKWDKDAHTWSTVTTTAQYVYNASIVYDPDNNRIVFVTDWTHGASGYNGAGYFDLNDSGTFVPCAPVGAAAAAFSRGYSPVWCNVRGSILLYPWSGGALYEAKWNGSAYVVTELSIAGDFPPNSDSSGCQRIAMWQDQNILCVVDATTNNMTVCRMAA